MRMLYERTEKHLFLGRACHPPLKITNIYFLIFLKCLSVQLNDFEVVRWDAYAYKSNFCSTIPCPPTIISKSSFFFLDINNLIQITKREKITLFCIDNETN